MKKFFAVLLSVFLAISLAGRNAANASEAAGSQTAGAAGKSLPATVTVATLNGNREKMEIEVPYNPKRLAVMDLAVLDMLDNFGLGDRVVGVSKGSSIDYLQKYVTNDSIINLGTIKEASLEAVMECEPDIIFIGGRLSAQYDKLSKIAPVIFLATDVEIGLVQSTIENAMTVASIFGVKDTLSGLLAEYDARVKALARVAKNKTAVVGIVNAGGFGVLGNDGRCSIIGVEVGFENVGLSAVSPGRGGSGSGGNAKGAGRKEGGSGGVSAIHGNEASFEVLVSLNPDYIFVMDRDAAIGTGGARLAREVMDNKLVAMTEAYKNGNIVILKHSNVWYTAEGGITALGIMLSDLEAALL